VTHRPVGGVPTPPRPPVGDGINHINRQIPPEAHTSMYVWHKYWGRKTWNVVGEYVKTYCPEGGIVLDPFAGSGVIAMEALKAGRRAIVCDILPISTELIRLTIKPVDINQLVNAFKRVEERSKAAILNLYETKCRKCNHVFPFECAIWKGDSCTEIRYSKCPRCGDRKTKNCKLVRYDKVVLDKIEKERISTWYPKQRLYYPDGTPFKEKQKYESLDQLFTKRNLRALSILMDSINKESNREIRDFLKIGFTSMVHLCSRMCPISEGGHFTPFSSAWVQHSYWWPSGPYMEQNVWHKYESAILGHQGLKKAKEESNAIFGNVRISEDVDDVISGKADLHIHLGDSVEFMHNLASKHGSCIDYIFTDPPYDASIQYGELAYLWVAWLNEDTGYLDRLIAHEVIRNKRQNKDFTIYNNLLSNSFRGMYDILKSDSHLTLTFHNPTFMVRNATIHAAVMSGLDFVKIHHQELARSSPKSLLQPFGSAQGDFYLRFHKSGNRKESVQPEQIDAIRFERIVIEKAIEVIAKRGEPTPYTILINSIDPELARNGYFSALRSGLDVSKVLESHLGQEFVLVTVRIGGAEGKVWWFKDPSSIALLQSVPLSDRVEQTVLRKLQERVTVTFTDMWAAISEQFPNALTMDSTSIKEALEEYAQQIGLGKWKLRPEYQKDQIKRLHTRMISIIAEIGNAHGYEIWIGKKEQGDSIADGFPGRTGDLRQYVKRPSLEGISDASNVRDIEFMDVLWLKKKNVVAAFEVENSTTMTEGIKRGSNLSPDIPKYMVLPQDREGQLKRKQNSPFFREGFEKGSWAHIYFEVLEDAYRKEKGDLSIKSLIGKKIRKSSFRRVAGNEQLDWVANVKRGESEEEEE